MAAETVTAAGNQPPGRTKRAGGAVAPALEIKGRPGDQPHPAQREAKRQGHDRHPAGEAGQGEEPVQQETGAQDQQGQGAVIKEHGPDLLPHDIGMKECHHSLRGGLYGNRGLFFVTPAQAGDQEPSPDPEPFSGFRPAPE